MFPVPKEIDQLILSFVPSPVDLTNMAFSCKTAWLWLNKQVIEYKDIGSNIIKALELSNIMMTKYLIKQFYPRNQKGMKNITEFELSVCFRIIFEKGNMDIYTFVFDWFYNWDVKDKKTVRIVRALLRESICQDEWKSLEAAAIGGHLDIIKAHKENMHNCWKKEISNVCFNMRSVFWVALMHDQIDIVQELYDIQIYEYGKKITWPRENHRRPTDPSNMTRIFCQIISNKSLEGLQWLRKVSEENDKLDQFNQSFWDNISCFYELPVSDESFVLNVMGLCVDVSKIDPTQVFKKMCTYSRTRTLPMCFLKYAESVRMNLNLQSISEETFLLTTALDVPFNAFDVPTWIVEVCEMRKYPVNIHANGDIAYQIARTRGNKLLANWLEWIGSSPLRPYGPIDPMILRSSPNPFHSVASVFVPGNTPVLQMQTHPAVVRTMMPYNPQLN